MNRKFAAMCVLAASAFAQDPRQVIEEVQRRSRSHSQRYEGTLEVVGAGNRIATKRWTFERIGSFGDSKALLRFAAPAEVKGVALLIVNHPDRASDQWMWRPSIGRDHWTSLILSGLAGASPPTWHPRINGGDTFMARAGRSMRPTILMAWTPSFSMASSNGTGGITPMEKRY